MAVAVAAAVYVAADTVVLRPLLLHSNRHVFRQGWAYPTELFRDQGRIGPIRWPASYFHFQGQPSVICIPGSCVQRSRPPWTNRADWTQELESTLHNHNSVARPQFICLSTIDLLARVLFFLPKGDHQRVKQEGH